MTIRKFEGETKEAAIEAAKAELGEAVVIMNAKEVHGKGLLGLFKHGIWEVTAAIEDDSVTPSVEAFREAAARAKEERRIEEQTEAVRRTSRFSIAADDDVSVPPARSGRAGLSEADEADLKSAFAEIGEVLEGAQKKETVSQGTGALPQPGTYDKNAALVKYSDPAGSNDYTKDGTGRLPVAELAEEEQPVMRSLSAPEVTERIPTANEQRMRPAESVRMAPEPPRPQPVPEPARPKPSDPFLQDENDAVIKRHQGVMRLLYNSLLKSEVDERYVNEVLDDIVPVMHPGESLEGLFSNVYQKMVLKLGRPQPIELGDHKPHISFFVGPTGVGKTTTIAKIAANYKDRKVAFLTSDTYRLAAPEQLSHYAEILDIPMEVLYPGDDINDTIAGYKNYDLILVDTAGFSHRNTEMKSEMEAIYHMVNDAYEKEAFLVLSATTKYQDLKEIVDAYASFIPFNIIFTKLDETGTYGNILNIKNYANAPLSYVTMGQEVPKDIDILDAQKLVRSLLEVH